MILEMEVTAANTFLVIFPITFESVAQRPCTPESLEMFI